MLHVRSLGFVQGMNPPDVQTEQLQPLIDTDEVAHVTDQQAADEEAKKDARNMKIAREKVMFAGTCKVINI